MLMKMERMEQAVSIVLVFTSFHESGGVVGYPLDGFAVNTLSVTAHPRRFLHRG